ncbi:ECF transporter S component [Haloplasma contractile]|uniref:ABC transporter permease protein n=1 Tax=Haloplasma contractile SSD-17B TaxID=1033810 RepID=U2EEN5_9MOLU|nr:ECF transporter S component [Haloplasma contractile]ERJ13161.1 ABC transporter permease protein [Haloplasma contractile SSD-17B]
MKKGLKLTDILVTIVIALIFGLIYKLWGPLYATVSTVGLHIDQLIYGMWFMAATVAYLIIRKPGVALIAELAAAQGEFIFGGHWGASTIIYGLLQGLAVELVFLMFRYKRYDMLTVCLASVAATLASIPIDYYYGYIGELATWNLILYLAARFVGAILISGVLAHVLVRSLEKTSVTNLVRPVSSDDYIGLE